MKQAVQWKGHLAPASGEETGRTGTRVLLVDDHRLFAEAIAFALAEEMDALDVATNAEEALAIAQRRSPDLVLIDFSPSDGDSIEVGRTMLESYPEAKVIALAESDDPGAIRKAVQLGFHGYLTKDISWPRFVSSIRSVLEGLIVVPQRLASVVGGGRSREEREAARRGGQLTRREREVLVLLGMGAGSADIAHQLTLSLNTVRTHVANILAKLQVHSRLEAVAFALRYGIVDAPGAGHGDQAAAPARVAPFGPLER